MRLGSRLLVAQHPLELGEDDLGEVRAGPGLADILGEYRMMFDSAEAMGL